MALDKDVKVVKTGAWSGGPGCHGGCGVELFIKDGKLVKVEGDEQHPFLQGRLCPRALALTQYAYHPNRLQYPLRRVGARGENKWARITWKEALDEIEYKFDKIRKEDGAESMVFGQGTGRDAGGSLIFLAYAYGSPNWTLFGLSGIACFTPRLAAMNMVAGDIQFEDAAQCFPDRYNDPDFKVPELMIIWGRGTRGSQCADHYYSSHFVIDLMKRGTKFIVVDPRQTWMSTHAEKWLQIRPGTDCALAMGMLNVIINEELYDKEFVEKWTYGFDELKKRVQEYPPEKVAEITWAKAEDIVAAARMYAKAKPASIRWGQPLDSNANSIGTIQALNCLWAITGNLDVPGGEIIARPPYKVTIYPYSTWETVQLYGQEFVDMMNQKRIGCDKYPLVKNFRSWAISDDVLEQMETQKPYPIRGLYLYTNNFMACTAQDPRRYYEAVKKLDFNVVADCFMTPTCQAIADLVIPGTTFAEKDSVFTTGVPLNAIHKEIQVAECRSHWEVAFELAKHLNPQAVPWPTLKDLFDARIAVSGKTFDELCENTWDLAPKDHESGCSGYYRYEKGLLRNDKQPGFNTPTGKVELYSTLLEKYGADPLPHHEEPMESPLSTPEVYEEYPLILITGRRMATMFHSEHRQIPWLRQFEEEPIVELNPKTAEKYGLTDGEWVWIEGVRGKCKRKLRCTPVIHEKIAMAPHAWWLPETDGAAPNLYGVWDINVNQLIPTGHNHPLTGYGGAPTKTMLCKIYPLGSNDAIPTEHTQVNRLDFSDLYNVVSPEDMAVPGYCGDKPTEFATESSWNIPQNTPVYSFRQPQDNMEVKHAELSEIYEHIHEFKAEFENQEFPAPPEK
ncbi:MAG: molybdopterin-dependent oxidoreductase [Oscillospiraceae bacterium]|nr:molybdopterin-dependent oxidoreductase [Oscillospiraceae bacterium]